MEIFNQRATIRKELFETDTDSDDTSDESEDIEEKKNRFSFDDFVDQRGATAAKDVFGFEVGEVRELCAVLEPCIRKSGRGRRGMSAIDVLAIFLCWATSGLPFTKISSLLGGISKSTVERNVKIIVTRAKTILVQKFLPQSLDRQRTTLTFTNFPNAVGALDATVVTIWKPSDKEKQKFYYDGKHKDHTIKFQILVGPDGVALHLSQIVEGKKHDKKLFDESDILSFLSYDRVVGRATRIVRHQILCDSGYVGINSTIPEAQIALKKPAGGELTAEEKAYNKNLSHDRVIVENFFARMKVLFGIVAEDYR